MPTIEELAARDVISLDEKTTCNAAALFMAQRCLGFVGVTRAGKLVGLVTERDLVYNVMAVGKPGTTTVGEVMRADGPAVSPHATELDCAQLMQAHSRRHLLVKEGDTVVGVITMLDVLSLICSRRRADGCRRTSRVAAAGSGASRPVDSE